MSAEATQRTLTKTRYPTHPPLILDGCRFREFSTPRWTAPLTQVHPPGARRPGGFGLFFFLLMPVRILKAKSGRHRVDIHLPVVDVLQTGGI